MSRRDLDGCPYIRYPKPKAKYPIPNAEYPMPDAPRKRGCGFTSFWFHARNKTPSMHFPNDLKIWSWAWEVFYFSRLATRSKLLVLFHICSVYTLHSHINTAIHANIHTDMMLAYGSDSNECKITTWALKISLIDS